MHIIVFSTRITYNTTRMAVDGIRIPTIDLFSGIGGFSFALGSVCKTVAYCEIDPACRCVLEARMRTGDLPRAPVHDDVRTFPTLASAVAPRLLTAGFPCQDVSVMASSDSGGLFGPRTGLFFHILEILRRHPTIDVVVLENSSNLINRGWDHALHGLSRRGYTYVAYATFTAREVGALHRRARLYCIASRPTRAANALLKRIGRCTYPAVEYDWSDGREPCPRVRPRLDREHTRETRKRCMMLGNSIVPACAVYAVRELSHALTTVRHGHHLRSPRSSETERIYGIISSSPPSTIGVKRPSTFTRSCVERTAVDEHGNRIVRPSWMTPTYKNWEQYRVLTRRGSGLLSNQIFYDAQTIHPCLRGVPINDRDKQCQINPPFIEYLMGFPLHWTAC